VVFAPHQVLFPKSYSATSTWVSELRPRDEQLLVVCQRRLQEAIAGDEEFNRLAAGAKVNGRTIQTTGCCQCPVDETGTAIAGWAAVRNLLALDCCARSYV